MENFLDSVVSLKGAAFVPGQETSEVDATFDATLAAMCGLAPWCRILVWLSPDAFRISLSRELLELLGFCWERQVMRAITWVSAKGKEKVAEDNAIGSSKAFLLLSVPQVKLVSSKFLFFAPAALARALPLVELGSLAVSSHSSCSFAQ